jgi:tetratricopeptide (TPR) repeat protein
MEIKRRASWICGFLFGLAVVAPALSAQEVFRNPAMEPNDEFNKAYVKARELAERGRIDDAVAEFRRAASLKDDKCAECFQMIGQVLWQSGDYKGAAAAYRQAVQLKPENEAELHNALGVMLYLQKDKSAYVEATNEFQKAIDQSKGRVVKAYYNLGHALIKMGRKEDGIAAFKTYLEKEPNAKEAVEIRAIIANPKNAGEPFAPSFNVKSTQGDQIALDKLRGKIVLLDFWASWCGPCREDMPEVRKIWKQYSGENFVMIGINLDRDQRAFDKYVREQGVSWPQYFDGGGWNNKVSRLYGVHAIPHTVLIDQDGIIRATGLRAGRLSKAIGDLLRKVPAAENRSETR